MFRGMGDFLRSALIVLSAVTAVVIDAFLTLLIYWAGADFWASFAISTAIAVIAYYLWLRKEVL